MGWLSVRLFGLGSTHPRKLTIIFPYPASKFCCTLHFLQTKLCIVQRFSLQLWLSGFSLSSVGSPLSSQRLLALPVFIWSSIHCLISAYLVFCHAKSVAWTNRVISPGFIMWPMVWRLFNCLATLDGPPVTTPPPPPRCVAWAVASFSRVEREETFNTPLGWAAMPGWRPL